MKALAPSVLAGPTIFGAAAFSVTDASLKDLQAEAKRRGQIGSMSKLHSERAGG